MDWKFNEDNSSSDNSECESTCPVCLKKLLEKKLEKMKLMSQYQQTKFLLLEIEKIEKEIERIKKEKENEWYILLCKKHNDNTNSI